MDMMGRSILDPVPRSQDDTLFPSLPTPDAGTRLSDWPGEEVPEDGTVDVSIGPVNYQPPPTDTDFQFDPRLHGRPQDKVDTRPLPPTYRVVKENDPCEDLIRCLRDKPDVLLKLKKVIEDSGQEYIPELPAGQDHPPVASCSGPTDYWQFGIQRNLIMYPPLQCLIRGAKPGSTEYKQNVIFLKAVRSRCFNKIAIRHGEIFNIMAAIDAGYKMSDIIPMIYCCSFCDNHWALREPECNNAFGLSIRSMILYTKRYIYCKQHPENSALRQATNNCNFPDRICDDFDPCNLNRDDSDVITEIPVDIPYNNIPEGDGAGFYCYYVDEPATDSGWQKSCKRDSNYCSPESLTRLKLYSQELDISLNNGHYTPIAVGEWNNRIGMELKWYEVPINLLLYEDIADGFSYTAYHNLDSRASVTKGSAYWRDQRPQITWTFNSLGNGYYIRSVRDHLEMLANNGNKEKVIKNYEPWFKQARENLIVRQSQSLHELATFTRLPYNILWINSFKDFDAAGKWNEYGILSGHASSLGMASIGFYAGDHPYSCKELLSNIDEYFLPALRSAQWIYPS